MEVMGMFWDAMRGFWGAVRRFWGAMSKFWGGMRGFWEGREVLGVMGWIGGDGDFLGCDADALEAQG